ncbi:Sideroflexin FSF1 [Balamuthia mandrillaris]
MATSSPANPARVDLSVPRYDQATFWGRFRHFLDVTDPLTLLTTQQQLEGALTVLRRYENREQDYPLEELYKAKKIRDAVIHPDTGEKIFAPFRMSSFLPVNIAIVLGLTVPNPGMGTTLFWQWFNQSYNVALNHANRNASNEMSNSQIMKAYAGAVGLSCSLAVGLNEVVKRATAFTPAVRTAIQNMVPFTAVAAAGVLNVFMMRGNEMKEGIDVKDAEGNIYGRSQKAGYLGLVKTSISRVATSFVVLTIPPMCMTALQRTSLFTKNPRLKHPVHLGIISATLWLGLPAAIALFPQTSSVHVSSLEPKYQNLRDRHGNPITTLYYNKGL